MSNQGGVAEREDLVDETRDCLVEKNAVRLVSAISSQGARADRATESRLRRVWAGKPVRTASGVSESWRSLHGAVDGFCRVGELQGSYSWRGHLCGSGRSDVPGDHRRGV